MDFIQLCLIFFRLINHATRYQSSQLAERGNPCSTKGA